VVVAGEFQAAADLVPLELQHRDVHRAVAEDDPAAAEDVEPAYLLLAGGGLGEVGKLFRFLAGDGDMPDAAHVTVRRWLHYDLEARRGCGALHAADSVFVPCAGSEPRANRDTPVRRIHVRCSPRKALENGAEILGRAG
jgi:hypothetical protein